VEPCIKETLLVALPKSGRLELLTWSCSSRWAFKGGISVVFGWNLSDPEIDYHR